MIYGVHRGVCEAFKTGRSSVSCHNERTEGVYRRLNNNVGEREYRSLKSGRQTDVEHLLELITVNPHILRHKTDAILRLHHVNNDHHRREYLRDYGSIRDTRNSHMENDDKNKVEYYIYKTGDREKVQRALCVSYRAKNGRAEVVSHVSGSSDKVYHKILCREREYILRASHPDKELTREN